MPVRIFLSSKMDEFSQERAAIVSLLTAIHGFQVNAAERSGPHSNTVENFYRGGVRESHIYLGLFGRCYGVHTHAEYQEACKNPYRQKLIYLKKSVNIDPQLQQMIKKLQRRHKTYTFIDQWDLLPRVPADLDLAVEQILNQNLELGIKPPVAHSGEDSVALRAWKNKQDYLAMLYQHDHDLTAEDLGKMRASLVAERRKLKG